MKRTALAVFVVMAMACSGRTGTSGGMGGGSSAGGGSAAGGSGGTGGSGGGGGAGGGDAGIPDAGHAYDGGVCPPGAPYGGGEVTVAGGGATADVIDQLGAAVASQPIYICGLDICSNPGITTAQGHANINTTIMMKKPAFKVGDAITYAEIAIPLKAPTTALGTLTTGKFPDVGTSLNPGAAATSGDVTLTLASDATVLINGLVYDTDDKQKLRTVKIPTVDGGVFAGATVADFGLLYGASPAETLFCPAAKVTVTLPAGLGWTAGAGVEFWIMTTDTNQTFAPYAGWAKVSDGAVSADGLTVSTSDGQGFPTLENFAIRLK